MLTLDLSRSRCLRSTKFTNVPPGQWILLRITDHADDHWPSAGRILIRAPTQRDVLDALEKQTPADRKPQGEGEGPICLFCAYPDLVAGPEYEALLDALVSDATTSN